MDEQRLKDSFARVAGYGDEVALFFYSHLFLAHPELRDMFPVSMSVQRDRLLNALGQVVSDVGQLDSLVPFLAELGRDHRKFGVRSEHYPAVGRSLVATLAHFAGDAWDAELARDWTTAYGLVSQAMIEAAEQDERGGNPPWRDATVISHERRTLDIAVIKVAPRQHLAYQPGQSVAIEIPQRPRLWRVYSMANAPRPDGTIDFHVRIVDGGQVSAILGRGPGLGSTLRLGPPFGSLALGPRSGNPIVMAAGGTGLAPLKAILEQLGGQEATPDVHLFFGSRTAAELYDLPDLDKLAVSFPWLTVTPVVSQDPGFAGERGTVADALARHGTWRDHDAYVCGSDAMVTATVSRLAALGISAERTFIENFGWSEL